MAPRPISAANMDGLLRDDKEDTVFFLQDDSWLGIQVFPARARGRALGHCSSPICRAPFQPGEYRFSVEPCENMSLDEPNVELVTFPNKIANYGLTLNEGKLYHIGCLESLLAEETGFIHGVGTQSAKQEIGDYARLIFAEPRGPILRSGPNLWQLSKDSEYLVETWKAVTEYNNTPDRSMRVHYVSLAVKHLGHDHIRMRGPSDTIYTSKQSMEFCADIENKVAIPEEISRRNLSGKRLSLFLGNRADWENTLQERLDEDSSFRPHYIRMLEEEGVGTQSAGSSKEQDRKLYGGIKVLSKYPNSSDWMLGLEQMKPLSEWAMDSTTDSMTEE